MITSHFTVVIRGKPKFNCKIQLPAAAAAAAAATGFGVTASRPDLVVDNHVQDSAEGGHRQTQIKLIMRYKQKLTLKLMIFCSQSAVL